ncbi:hypothetical protein CC78DRAFT_571005 [Lojkania enalia]|uniref:F-box protein n=1 Tax=Lojkania enalia TaxID=147567 RepID=A0A9P4K0U0_9PLEO|nr:hypothetical protein CC78DRAFT_571005 [Didymosphaeria enalia]
MSYGSDHPRVLSSIFAQLHRNKYKLSQLHLRIRFGIGPSRKGLLEDQATAEVLEGLHDLNLHIEYRYERPLFGYMDRSMREDYRASLQQSCSSWLSPYCINLRHLSLDYGSGWLTDAGYQPKIDFRNTHFPHLRYLSIAHFLICHDWALDWLFKHGPTLVTLDLSFCPILRLKHSALSEDEGYNSHHYDRTWEELIDNLIESCPVLRSFSLVLFAGRIPEDNSKSSNSERFSMGQGLYVRETEPAQYEVVSQSRQIATAEDALLLSDEASFYRLIDRLGRENCIFEAVRDDQDFAYIDTEDEWWELDEHLEKWSVDSQGNLFTSVPLLQREPRDH